MLSGGQKQRLSIARAIAKNPDILIFDDSFSALDYTTDKKVRKNLVDFAKDKTLIIVAQRISTIKDAEQILVLDKGEIVGRGTHSELLQNNEIYREIAKSQFFDSEINKEMGIAEKLAKTKQSLQPHREKQQRADKLQRPGGIAMIRRTYKSTSKPTNKGEKNG
jgi:ABC-type multidrug transport system ATPase subunit